MFYRVEDSPAILSSHILDTGCRYVLTLGSECQLGIAQCTFTTKEAIFDCNRNPESVYLHWSVTQLIVFG